MNNSVELQQSSLREVLVEKMLKNTQFPAPKFVMNKDIKNFYDFTVDDFALIDYEYNKIEEKFEVAV